MRKSDDYYSVEILTTTDVPDSEPPSGIIAGSLVTTLVVLCLGCYYYFAKYRRRTKQAIEETPPADIIISDKQSPARHRSSSATASVTSNKEPGESAFSEITILVPENEKEKSSENNQLFDAMAHDASSAHRGGSNPLTSLRSSLIQAKLSIKPQDWTVEDVTKWLQLNGCELEELADVIRREEIDGIALLEIDLAQLFGLLQIVAAGRKAKLRIAIGMLKKLGLNGDPFGNVGSSGIGLTIKNTNGTSLLVVDSPPCYDEISE
ncbi:UNVERIFIED_CONTAM: hypothetical protein HDU68_005976 [Siphonaria sp. JEL0065]|nr:hypothetical protein HDU68_005976 [Siphonaria sp. JEL0065]